MTTLPNDVQALAATRRYIELNGVDVEPGSLKVKAETNSGVFYVVTHTTTGKIYIVGRGNHKGYVLPEDETVESFIKKLDSEVLEASFEV